MNFPEKTAKAQKRARLVAGGTCKQDNGLAAGGIKMGSSVLPFRTRTTSFS